MRVLKAGLAGTIASIAAVLSSATALAAAPTDPQAAAQQPLQIMRVPLALDLTGRVPVDVPVLVADTGIDTDHPDLAPRLLGAPAPNSDLIGNACNPGATVPDGDPNHPPGCSEHGTNVAGVLGAAWNNGLGGAGVAPNARFIPLRSCWDDDQCYQFVQADAFNFAIDQFGAKVVSMSWLVGAPEADFVAAIASHPNTLFVAIPSGNGGATDADPDAANRAPCSLNFPNVLCVTTSAPDDGLSCGDYGATLVDVAAPTENSVTTTNGGGFGPTGCATSFAAPTAAGVATILFGLFPQATPAEVRQAIIAGARPAAAWQGKSVSGGIIDAAGAVQALAGGNLVVPGLGMDLTARRKQRVEDLSVSATCSAACDLSVSAVVRVGGKEYHSRTSQATLAAGAPTSVKIRFKRATRNRIEGRAGGATITGAATAAEGSAQDTAEVRLKK